MDSPFHTEQEELPQGIVPRVEPQAKHHEFVHTVKPPFVMLKITDARRLANRGETATSYFGSVPTVITTSTVRDSDLFLLKWVDEYEILEQFEPDYHFPADESIYEEQPHEDRLSRVKRSLKGFLAIRELIEENRDSFTGTPPTLIPLLKGVSQDEQQACLRLFEEQGVRMAGFYAVQYFTNDGPPQQDALLEDLHDLHERSPPALSYFVIGGIGRTLTEQYPPSVDAAAGFTQWYSRVSSMFSYDESGSQQLSLEHAHMAYHSFAANANAHLNADVPVSYSPDWEDYSDHPSGAQP